MSILAALRFSWTATTGHWLRIVGLGCALGALTFPIFMIERAAFGDSFHIMLAALGSLYVLGTAQVYAFTDAGSNLSIEAKHARE
jgi:hypothetical protein